MTNSGAAGDESSSSTPNPPPPEETVRRRGGLTVRRVRHSWENALYTSPRPSVLPVFGANGRSAFGPYRPPAPQGPGPSRGTGGAVVAGPLRIGGNPSGRKRALEAGSSSGGGGGGGGIVPQRCSVCNKEFGSSKALFGHMRSHPDRGWKGVHPPPAFRAEEEFADLHAAEDDGRAAEEEAEVEADGGDAAEGTSYRVPDLNHPPPPGAI